ncbi:MAG TPA: DUF3500 domain-containing protein [Planctomicrobium sp.]|nr:DUF3500 domain-containing protein [Planctomicrobium sp.]
MTLPASQPQVPCDDCNNENSRNDVTRRDFFRHVGVSAAALGTLSLASPFKGVYAAPSFSSTAETAAQKLYETLTAEQRKVICLPFDHPSRQKISANWAVTKPLIHEDFFTPEQRGLIGETFRGITSEQGHKLFVEQMEFDDGGWDRYHIALFGTPESGQFQWMLTGRHNTLRADGNCVPGAAFGGPIVYGHGEEGDPKDNLFYYQTQQANKVFQALDAGQAKQALLATPPRETDVLLQGKGKTFSGIAVSSLSSDQQDLISSVIESLLNPYREEDVKEVMACLEKAGGVASLSMAFYQQNDLKNDQVWDIWRLEGPTFVSHFRGAPHVHAYLNVGTQMLPSKS